MKNISFSILALGAIIAVAGAIQPAQAQSVYGQVDPGAVSSWNLRNYYWQQAMPWTTGVITQQDVTGIPNDMREVPMISGTMRDAQGRIVPIPGLPTPYTLP